MPIKNTAFIITSFVFLSGCVPTAAWHNGGVSQKRANDQLTSCQVSATKDVPTSIENKITGGFFVGYIWIPTTSDVDTNNELRSKVVAQCMTNKGYRSVELPVCPAKVPMPDMNKRATINNNSCFKQISGGYYAIAQKS